MTFYPPLRDETAGPLIEQFGQAAIYRVYEAETYDNATGKTTQGAPTDVPVFLLDLPVREREFTQEVTEESRATLLVAARELAAAAVVPKVDAEVLFGGETFRILAINTVGPSGVAVIYKMAVK